MYRNKKKPFSFTKTHTQKNKYEDLTDSELNTKTREFENNNKNYLKHEPKYVKFLLEYETRYKKYIAFQDLVREFYRKNVVREKVKATTLIFIKYEQDDVYFNSKKSREDFFSLYKDAAKLFIENRDFFYKANSELLNFNYLFPKDDKKDYIVRYFLKLLEKFKAQLFLIDPDKNIPSFAVSKKTKNFI